MQWYNIAKMRAISITTFLAIVFVTGMFLGQYTPSILQSAKIALGWSSAFYITSDSSLQQEFASKTAKRVGWEMLLPEAEHSTLSQYLPDPNLSFSEQISRSISASVDPHYQSAMYSTNIVESLLDKYVEIPGFIVPVDTTDQRTLASFFIVPYFGACLHYPPPPPNQIIYVQVADDFPMPDIQKAYLLTGVLKGELYEDLLATSSYLLEIVKAEEYTNEPDDFRQH